MEKEVKEPIIFKQPTFEVEVITEPWSDSVGMDAWGNWYAWGIKEWYRLYDWNLAEKGVCDGWTAESDDGYGKSYMVFRNGFFWLTQDWNNAEHVGYRYRPWKYAEFRRMYHLLFDRHYEEFEVSFPALLDYVEKHSKDTEQKP